jgi:hypothetical protein
MLPSSRGPSCAGSKVGPHFPTFLPWTPRQAATHTMCQSGPGTFPTQPIARFVLVGRDQVAVPDAREGNDVWEQSLRRTSTLRPKVRIRFFELQSEVERRAARADQWRRCRLSRGAEARAGGRLLIGVPHIDCGRRRCAKRGLVALDNSSVAAHLAADSIHELPQTI